jgi:hypothetical protein
MRIGRMRRSIRVGEPVRKVVRILTPGMKLP